MTSSPKMLLCQMLLKTYAAGPPHCTWSSNVPFAHEIWNSFFIVTTYCMFNSAGIHISTNNTLVWRDRFWCNGLYSLIISGINWISYHASKRKPLSRAPSCRLDSLFSYFYDASGTKGLYMLWFLMQIWVWLTCVCEHDPEVHLQM